MSRTVARVKLGRLLIAVLVVAGPLLRAQAPRPEFTLQNGFDGRSEGDGSLRLFMAKSRPFHVESHGEVQSDGSFRLDQTITFQDEPPQDRYWIIETVSPNHYAGTLSDAPGAVSGRTIGPKLFLSYRANGPLIMHQTLELMPDGKTIDNVGKITLLGIPVGWLHETITRKE